MNLYCRHLIVNKKYWSKSNLGYKKFNDHKVYEKDKGANFYMAKYIDKEIDYYIRITNEEAVKIISLNYKKKVS